MRYYLKLVRWQNLVIIILTQVLIRYAVLKPLAGLMEVTIASTGITEPLSLRLSLPDFIIMVLATVAIAAGGYVINDYFDIRTDLINRGEVIVGTRVPRRKAMMWHNILNIAGVSAGFYISYKVGYFWIGLLFLVVSGLLYFYSSTYKRQFLIGNIIVALLVAMVPMLVLAYEIPVIYSYYSPIASEMPSLIVLAYWVGGFALFAFLTNLVREVIKDMEDFEGDRAYGSSSLPVVAGLTISRIFVVTLQVITVALLLVVWANFLHDRYTLVYMLSAIILPLLLSVYYVATGKDHGDFHRSSTYMKIVMLGGILYSLLVWIIVEKGLLG